MTTVGNILKAIRSDLRANLESERYFPEDDQQEFIDETSFPVLGLYYHARKHMLETVTFSPPDRVRNAPKVKKRNQDLDRLKKLPLAKRYEEYRLRAFIQLQNSLEDIHHFSPNLMGISDEVESLQKKITELLQRQVQPLSESTLVIAEHMCLRDLSIIFRSFAKKKNTSRADTAYQCGIGTTSPFVQYVQICYKVAGFPDPELAVGVSAIRERLAAVDLSFNSPRPPLPELSHDPERLVMKRLLPEMLKINNERAEQ